MNVKGFHEKESAGTSTMSDDINRNSVVKYLRWDCKDKNMVSSYELRIAYLKKHQQTVRIILCLFLGWQPGGTKSLKTIFSYEWKEKMYLEIPGCKSWNGFNRLLLKMVTKLWRTYFLKKEFFFCKDC